jgi:DNA polymerase-3 subunit delta
MAGRRPPAGAAVPDPFAAVDLASLRPYYFLYGADLFLLERGLARLRARLQGAGSVGHGGTVAWGDDAERIGAVLDELVSPSLFGGTSLLILRRAEALSAANEDAVLEVLPRLTDDARLVLVAKALDQRRRLHAACAKAGAAIAFPSPADQRAALAWIVTLARERGHAIGAPAAERLLDRTGVDLARIDDELEKLSLQVGPGAAIEARHVESLVAATRAHAIEELTDRLARRDVGGALRTLRGLFAAGEAPLRIVGFLGANLRRALHVSELLAMGLREDEVGARLGMPPWLVGKQARRGSPAALEAALMALAELDQALKSSRPDAATFEATLLAIGTRPG